MENPFYTGILNKENDEGGISNNYEYTGSFIQTNVSINARHISSGRSIGI
jgi:hypothetical protein